MGSLALGMRKLTPHHKKAALCSVAQFKLARAVRDGTQVPSVGAPEPPGGGGNQPMTCQRHAHGGNCARIGCELFANAQSHVLVCLALRACHAVTAEALVCSAERRWARLPGTIGRVYMLVAECGSDCACRPRSSCHRAASPVAASASTYPRWVWAACRGRRRRRRSHAPG